MRTMVEKQNLAHPVLWDDQGRNNKAYGITAWPFAYLIGPDGKVFWEGNPTRWLNREQKLKELHEVVERELKQSKK